MEHDEGGLEPGQVVSWPPQGGDETPPAETAPLALKVRAQIDKVFGKSEKPAGEEKPATEKPVVEGPIEEKPPTEVRESLPGAPYKLAIPDYVPVGEQTDERLALLDELSFLAPAAGITPEASQGVVDAMVDLVSMLEYKPADAYTTPSEAFEELREHFGDDAQAIVAQAHAFVAASPPALREYLDKTGYGNDLGAIYCLALANNHVFDFSPEEAQRHLDEYRADPESYYYSKNEHERRQALLEMQILGRLAEGKPVLLSEEIARVAKQGNIGARPESTPNAIEALQAALRREAAELANPKSKMFQGTAAEKAAAKARWFQITAKL